MSNSFSHTIRPEHCNRQLIYSLALPLSARLRFLTVIEIVKSEFARITGTKKGMLAHPLEMITPSKCNHLKRVQCIKKD